jgi:dTDP-4-dehydrorhamnose 3,5-epimerase
MLSVIGDHLGGVIELRADVFGDERGRFLELGRDSEFDALGMPRFVQTNVSVSRRGVLRGIHYQLPPHPQGKLVTVLDGAIWDVGVDLRRGSPTFAAWVGVTLDAESANLLYVPPGFGHGFVTMSDSALVMYRTTAYFDPDADRAVAHDDPLLGIEWPDTGAPVELSDKDREAPSVRDAELFA